MRPARIGLAAFALLLALNGMWAAATPDWRMIPAALGAWYLADLISGAVHMYMDYRPSRPGMGLAGLFFYEGPRDAPEYLAAKASVMKRVGPIERIVFDFKTHHPNPEALGRRGLERQVTSTILAGSLPAALVLTGINLLWRLPGWVTAGAVVVLLATSFAQYFHGALHRDDLPWPVAALRRLRLLMSPEAHALHHATLTRDFATISGWSNPPLNRVFNALRRRGRLPDSGLEPTS